MIGLKKACLVAMLATGLMAPKANAQGLEKLTIVVFGAPSLGNFLPPVITAEKFDQKHGLSITFDQRTPDAYSAEFNSGEYQLGGSAAVLTVGLADLRGVKVTYLFNLFDFWGAVVTSRPDVTTLQSLEGKDMAAAKGTTNYVMFDFFARHAGVDTSKISVINTATPGLLGYALADRAAAVQLWEPAYSSLIARKPALRTLDLEIAKTWASYAGGAKNIPYLGVAAHTDWVASHPADVPKLYATYSDAAQWITAHPDAAAALISPNGSKDDQNAIANLIRSNDRLGLDVQWANDIKPEINAVYRAGKSTAFLPGQPSAATIYGGGGS